MDNSNQTKDWNNKNFKTLKKEIELRHQKMERFPIFEDQKVQYCVAGHPTKPLNCKNEIFIKILTQIFIEIENKITVNFIWNDRKKEQIRRI